MSPESIGDYEILGEIGRGGMGVVYEARHPGHDRALAIKVLRTAGLPDPRFLERFLREGDAARRLDHPGIIEVLDVGETDGSAFIVMEKIDGRSLADLVADARASLGSDESSSPGAETLPPVTPVQAGPEWLRNAALLVKKAAAAIHHAHENGVIHRDVKPQNILLSEAGEIRVTDFGVARLEDRPSLTVTGDVMGTPLYMSPEQAAGSGRELDRRTDVYGLGVTLYELVTAHHPFAGETNHEIIGKILTQPAPAPRGFNRAVPKPLERIVLKSIAKDPEDRYATAADLAADLDRFLEGKPVQARPPGRALLTARTVRAHPIRSSLVLGGVVLLLIAGVFGWQAYARARRLANGEVLLTVHVAPGAATVTLHRFDKRGFVWEPEGEGVGTGETVEEFVLPGTCLIRAVDGAGRMDELQVDLTRGTVAEVSLTLRDEKSTTKGMKDVPRTSFLFQGEIEVTVEPFWISPFEVTNQEWLGYVNAVEDAPRPSRWEREGPPLDRPRHAVTMIGWQAAADYAHWRGCRLPTEAEWELAAGGPDGWLYPWGDEPDPERSLLYYQGGPVDRVTAPEAPFGVQGTLGPTIEWMANLRFRVPFVDGEEVPEYTATRGGDFTMRPTVDRIAEATHRHRGIETSRERGTLQTGIRLVRSRR